jgi:hypothetical protein
MPLGTAAGLAAVKDDTTPEAGGDFVFNGHDLQLGDDDLVAWGDVQDVAAYWDGVDYQVDLLSGDLVINLPGAHTSRASKVLITGNAGAAGGEPFLAIASTLSYSNAYLIRCTVNGVQKFLIDNEGDMTVGQSISAGSFYFGGGYDPACVTSVANNGICFGAQHANPARHKTLFGLGVDPYGLGTPFAPNTNVDQADATFRRRANLTDTYSEDGTVVRIERDLTNTSAGAAGSFLNWGDSAGSILGYIDTEGNYRLVERSSDPAEPAEGEAVIWMSDGSGKGDDGDILIASKAAGTTKWGTLFDHSAGSAW